MSHSPQSATSGLGRDYRRPLRTCVLLVVALWSYPATGTATLDECSEVCTEDTPADTACLYIPEDNQMPAFEADCELYGVHYEPGYCGDGYCGEQDGETPSNCESDCFVGPGNDPDVTPSCGDSTCDLGESNRSCPGDCPARTPVTCGDGVCELTETDSNCPSDCYYTDYCQYTSDCPGWATCRARRCVYDPNPTVCTYSTGGWECGGSERCVQYGPNSGFGICVPFF